MTSSPAFAGVLLGIACCYLVAVARRRSGGVGSVIVVAVTLAILHVGGALRPGAAVTRGLYGAGALLYVISIAVALRRRREGLTRRLP